MTLRIAILGAGRIGQVHAKAVSFDRDATLWAACIGGATPLLLKRMKIDPALASGPILTTITDMCGFLLVLNLAAAMMGHLVG